MPTLNDEIKEIEDGLDKSHWDDSPKGKKAMQSHLDELKNHAKWLEENQDLLNYLKEQTP